jgi:hypothetical protein
VKRTIRLCVAGLVPATAPFCQAQAVPEPAALGMTLTKMHPVPDTWLGFSSVPDYLMLRSEL